MIAAAAFSVLAAAQLAPPPQAGLRSERPSAPPRISVSDTGLAVGSRPLVVHERWILLEVPESAMSADLDGDGDVLDVVLHVHDLASGATTNLGLAGQFVSARAGRALLLVGESSHAATDLNGDGDAVDWVAFALDLASLVARNSGVDCTLASFDERWALLGVREASQGATDLDGDGEANDVVAFAWDLSGTTPPTNVGRALDEPSLPAASHGEFLLFSASEERGDINGDGDASDGVLHAHSGPSGATFDTGLALPDERYLPALVALGPHSAWAVGERAQGGADLDGDGDDHDAVLHVFDGVAVQSLALALGPPIVNLGAPGPQSPATMRLSARHLAFHVSEDEQGGTDLNGDGNTDGTALFLHDFALGSTRNLGMSAWEFALTDDWLAFEAVESEQGQNLNGDLARNDAIAHVHDVSTGATWNTGLATDGHFSHLSAFAYPPVQVVGDWVLVPALEGGLPQDYNGDGDATDIVPFLAHAPTRRLVALGLATGRSGPSDPNIGLRKFRARLHAAAGGALSKLVSETQQGGADLDGDGDATGRVLHVMWPGVDRRAWSTGVAALEPVLDAYGSSFPILAAEAEDGVDRNGDGDALDTVLRVVHVAL